MSLRTSRINFAVLHDGCSVRARFLARNKSARWIICFFARKGPEQFARGFLKAKNAATDAGAVDQRIGHINSAFGNDRTGKAIPNPSAPSNGQTCCREFLCCAGFVPDTVALAAAPLRPVFRARGPCERDGKKD